MNVFLRVFRLRAAAFGEFPAECVEQRQLPAHPREKRIADDVKKTLQSAIANAENNHGLDVDELIVAEAYVGKNLTMKRGRPRARGRYGRIFKPFAQVTILVRQPAEEQA